MPGISSLFDVATRSMSATKLGLNTSNHNISNANTQGYSKQRVQLTTAEPFGVGEAVIGNGVRVAGTTRAHSEFLQRQIIDESGIQGKYKSSLEALSELERVVNESINEKLNQSFSEFFNGFRDLSTNPESEAVRRTVMENSRILVRTVKGVNNQLDGIRDSIDFRIKHRVNRVNELTEQIAGLNGTIRQVAASGLDPNDEMDKRDLAIRELSQITDIHLSTDDKGFVNVTIGNRLPVVIGVDNVKLTAVPTEADLPGDGAKRDGSVDIFAVTPSGAYQKARMAMTGGEIAGLMEIRDGALNELRDRLDQMVYSFSNTVNDAHRLGFGRDGVSGRNFFIDLRNRVVGPEKVSDPHFGAMARFDIAQTSDSSDFLAAALAPSSPGDNRVALAIAGLEKEKILENGQATISDFYGATVGKIGTLVKSNEGFLEHHEDILRQLNRYRDSLVGVSMDEEAANLIKLQQQFNASAKIIQMGDEMLQTVLSIKR